MTEMPNRPNSSHFQRVAAHRAIWPKRRAALRCGWFILFATGLATAIAAAETSGGAPSAGTNAAASDSDTCAAPAELTLAGTDFPNIRAALKAGSTVEVLAIGSATMLGPSGATEGSFPSRMAALLHDAFPAADVRLTVRSGRGMTAADMLAALPGALAEKRYQLVLWQTATVEAVRNLPPDELFQTLTEGARRVHEANADLVLIDPQYSRFLRANANLDPYLQAMQQAAALPDVFLLRRYDLMRQWVDSGRIDLERASRGDRQAVANTLHDCLGRTLADVILRIPPP